MSDKDIQDHLGLESGSTDGPVECFGQEFESNAARREHYLGLLREKLKDPDFRNQPGFPIGEDEDILGLSDPPYYTACPNPWVGEFVTRNGTSEPAKHTYHREPFAADVSEGKNHPIYTTHGYHTKVPHRAIMRYLLHYTKPGDVVLDAFAGSGMTGVAAALCGDKREVASLGDSSEVEIGKRKAILFELAPSASLIAHSYNTANHADEFSRSSVEALRQSSEEYSWMYKTTHSGDPSIIQALADKVQAASSIGELKTLMVSEVENLELANINYTLWSDVFSCPECGTEFSFWNEAVETGTWKVKDEFQCPRCQINLKKTDLEQITSSWFDSYINEVVAFPKCSPSLIHYKHNRKTVVKQADALDKALSEKLNEIASNHPVPDTLYMHKGAKWGDSWRAGYHRGISHAHHFFLGRSLHFLAAFSDNIGAARSRINVVTASSILSKMYRFRSQKGSLGAGGGPLSGTLYIPSLIKEIPAPKVLASHIRKTATMRANSRGFSASIISTGSSSSLTGVPDNSIDYLFVDPPFGGNLMYSELNFLWEAWLGVFTNTKPEAITNESQEKGLKQYQLLMLSCFQELYRVLKPGRWMTVEFSNSRASVWNSIQSMLQEAGFIVAHVAALDKKQHSFKSVTSTTAVKQDLVISAYKPAGQLEINFLKHSDSPQGVWDFIDYHLTKLPVPKPKGGQLEVVAERDPRILFDRTVAFFVCHETPVPVSSGEFQEELYARYAERDGMIFLADQVAAYDLSRAKIESVGQLTIFVEDEKSAINWLRNFLKRRPSTYQDIQPEFMRQLGASWKQWESRPELSFLLNQAFLQYKGDGPVPSQIHNYLSTQFKNLRNLGKEDPGLKAKAADRWFVPDPSKQKDMDELRERRLLEEFWSYLPPNYVPPALSASTGGDDLSGLKFQIPKIPKGKKMKELRTEAIRAGFRFCYQKKDYQTMLVAAQIIPDAVIEEDEQLQLLYDTAVTRSGVED